LLAYPTKMIESGTAAYLDSAVDSLFRAGSPLRDTLPVLARIRHATPKMKVIWRNSAQDGNYGQRDELLGRWDAFEIELRASVAKGEYDLGRSICPEGLFDEW
jgi:hypothetical protein